MSTLEQKQYDEDAMSLLVLVIQLGRAGKPYKEEMKQLKEAIKKSPKTVQYMKNLTANIIQGQ